MAHDYSENTPVDVASMLRASLHVASKRMGRPSMSADEKERRAQRVKILREQLRFTSQALFAAACGFAGGRVVVAKMEIGQDSVTGEASKSGLIRGLKSCGYPVTLEQLDGYMRGELSTTQLGIPFYDAEASEILQEVRVKRLPAQSASTQVPLLGEASGGRRVESVVRKKPRTVPSARKRRAARGG